MSGRILLFKGLSQYDVVRGFIEDLATAFRTLDKEVLVIDLASENHNVQLLQDAFSKECDFACGFNLNGYDLGIGQEGIKFLKDVGIPYIGIFTDNPLYHSLKFRLVDNVGMPDNFLITCVDKHHLEVLEYCSKVSFSSFLPHAGSYRDDVDRYRNMESRTKDVVFCGSYSKPNISWTNHPMKPLLDDIADFMLSSESIQVQDALQQALQTKNYVLSPEFFQRILDVVVHVDIYVRNVRRTRMIAELADAGIKLSIYGNGWEQLSCTKPFKVYKAVSFDEVLKIMADTKIVLNLVDSFSYGSHERVFSAMLNGAVALTDVNGYWRDEFVEEKEIVTYSMLQLNKLPLKITELLSDLSRLNAIAHAGQEKAKQSHTWKARAQEIIKLVQMLNGFRLLKR
ncbi:glycosyltransferase family protein [Pelosinus baikalensis]|uniref:Glycosyltransferase n=1 Tax=Pelosinus baikalensis TaxID=2892015 RepID=A0ABS8HP56_9FIRM|nr:glycosyltransferase [Pelosinus baikalensis]MCC5464033.1 glycosyltransferase [Pelosinus baikalensis]